MKNMDKMDIFCSCEKEFNKKISSIKELKEFFSK